MRAVQQLTQERNEPVGSSVAHAVSVTLMRLQQDWTHPELMCGPPLPLEMLVMDKGTHHNGDV